MKSSLIAIIQEQERLALAGGRLQEDRIEAMDAYLGRPYGDEEEGRSQVVMRDVADTVEWIKPSLMKVFCSGDEVCVFNPTGPEDEEQAKQETDWCNHVLMQKNPGFLVLHDWFHDALLQKNGYVLVSHVTESRKQRSKYAGLTDDEFAQLVQGEETELLEHTQGLDGTHEAVVQSKREYGCIKITNVPPERVLVAADWPGVSLEGCPFVEVIDYKTVSELREDGFDVPDDISDETSADDEFADDNRRVTLDSVGSPEEQGADAATRRLKTRYIWMRVDEDGDGIAEQRAIVAVGTTILENEEDDLTPVACCVPYRVPHEHNGLSVHDFVEDIQRIRTALVRGFLDSMYLVNNPRSIVDATTVNVDDLLTTRPGGIVRNNGPIHQAIAPLVQAADGASILQSIEYMDTVRENRTGVTKYNQGLDANSLNKTAHGIQQVMSASQQRIELIARIIAETGMKTLMLIIHAMGLKHSREQEMVKLRNQWVPVDPRSWKTRSDLTVSVGLGTGNKDQMLQHLQMILMAQKEAIPLGLVNKKNVHNALTKLTQNAGFRQPEEFWVLPEDAEQPIQMPPDPNQMKVQAEVQGKQAELQMKQQEVQAGIQAKQQESQIDLEKARIELQIKLIDLDIKRQELGIKQQSAEMDLQMKAQSNQQTLEHKAQAFEQAQSFQKERE
jgi:hypothetical protein